MAARPIVAGCGILLAFILTACAGEPMTTDPSTSRPPYLTSPSPLPMESLPSGEPTDVPAARWDGIVDDLAERGVSTTPTLVSAEAITWNNGALGCPRPGESYTQALVDGMRVVVEADGTTYDYRFGTTDSPKLCEPMLPSSLRHPSGWIDPRT
jgi:hypothetical protein